DQHVADLCSDQDDLVRKPVMQELDLRQRVQGCTVAASEVQFEDSPVIGDLVPAFLRGNALLLSLPQRVDSAVSHTPPTGKVDRSGQVGPVTAALEPEHGIEVIFCRYGVVNGRDGLVPEPTVAKPTEVIHDPLKCLYHCHPTDRPVM